MGFSPEFCVPRLSQVRGERWTGGWSSKTCRNRVSESNRRFRVGDLALVRGVIPIKQSNWETKALSLIPGLTKPGAGETEAIEMS